MNQILFEGIGQKAGYRVRSCLFMHPLFSTLYPLPFTLAILKVVG